MTAQAFEYTFFAEQRPCALVVSHERSGTHFLMNALASCYGYVAQPWINLDVPEANINYFDPSVISEYLRLLAGRPLANIVKSHHAADFFAGELARLTQRYVILSVCRHPVSVMVSYWRFLHGLPWFEGPKVADPLTLARSEPWGLMRRYHLGQYPTLLRRWAAHGEGWLAAAESQRGIAVVRYEDLDAHFEETMLDLAPFFGRTPQVLACPPRGVNVVPGGPEDPTGCGPPDIEALERLCRDEVGATMARLGY
ncbi:MAG: hypothetical protein B7Z73_01550 [Planctomycetia bacterium 21-64-5]|nr:MAG: hypothetical protein B7Z73_01550 [Planctomycetia bacterium 21-64-5]HQU41303.1 sulfotransferase domain-containing protein [Pirellulales bacterium]